MLLKFIFLLTILFITYVIFVSIGNKKREKIKKEMKEDEKKIQQTEIEESTEVVLYFQTDSIKISVYSSYTFRSFRVQNLYKKMVVKRLLIDEPFHTTFVQLLQIYDTTESWIKSKKTKEIKLKIRTKNGNFQEGTSFKVYSVSEIIFNFLDNLMEYIDNYKYSKNDQKNVILSVLIWKLDLVMELKYLCEKNLNDIEKRDCLAKKLLKNYEKNHDVFQILLMLEARHENLLFVFEAYEKVLKWQPEYPYVQKDEEQYKNIRLEDLATKNSKKLISLDAF